MTDIAGRGDRYKPIDFRAINEAALRSNARGFLQTLIPGGKFRGLEYVVQNPKRNDQSPGSFSINYRSGLWKDFATGEGGGDLISLVAYVRGIGQGEAARALATELGTQVSRSSAPPTLNGSSTHNHSTHDEVVVPIPPDAPPLPTEHPDLGRRTAVWSYYDAAGGLLGYVYRFERLGEKKQHRPLTLHRGADAAPKWLWKTWPTPRPLYGLDKLAARLSAKVLIAEGEKSADAAQRLLPDYVVVTSPNGSKAAKFTDWSPLRGRDALIWPDADEPGEKYRQDVTECLMAIGAKSVTAITPPAGVKESWDAADALNEDGWTPERAAEFIAASMTEASEEPDGDGPDEDEPEPLISVDEADKEIRRLASLPPLQYERERSDAAKRLGMRAGVLDGVVKSSRPVTTDTKGQGRAFEMPPIEPWPDPVDGAELLDEVTQAIKCYVVLPTNSPEILALWAVHTHCFECFGITPRAAITSPTWQCGKTTTLDVLEHLVARPLQTSNVTASVVFRVVELVKPTLLVDEADTFLKEDGELRGILNTGHRRGGQVLRNVGDNHEPRMFSTWAPMAIAMIGKLPGTLHDRSVVINLRRRMPHEEVKLFRSDRVSELDVLARKAARWAQDHQVQLADTDPDMGELFNRVADNWRALFAIADVAGGHWPQKIRDIAAAADKVARAQAAATKLLQDIKWIFDGRPEKDEQGNDVRHGAGVERISSEDLVGQLNAIEGAPWADWNKGRGITQSNIAKQFEGFQIESVNLRFGARVLKGYRREDFDDAFTRYIPTQIPPNFDATPLHFEETITKSSTSPNFSSRYKNANVAADFSPNPLINKDCSGVAANLGGLRGGEGHDDLEAPEAPEDRWEELA